MKLYSIETGQFALDGGAMFGVVPKVLWQKTNPADHKNRIPMAMRCLLIEDGDRLILVDNGIGHKYNEKFASIYGIDNSEITLEKSLNKLGFGLNDVTDVFLTHLHFDHCGGSTFWHLAKERFELVFINAMHWVQKSHLQWAQNPNPREKASFFHQNIGPLVASEQLTLLEGESEFHPGIQIKVVNGHTEAQQLPLIEYKGKKILFGADLFPTFGHIPLPYVMGYDVRPLVTMEERAHYLDWMIEEEVVIFYEHDPYHECGLVTKNEKGGFVSGDCFKLTDI